MYTAVQASRDQPTCGRHGLPDSSTHPRMILKTPRRPSFYDLMRRPAHGRSVLSPRPTTTIRPTCCVETATRVFLEQRRALRTDLVVEMAVAEGSHARLLYVEPIVGWVSIEVSAVKWPYISANQWGPGGMCNQGVLLPND